MPQIPGSDPLVGRVLRDESVMQSLVGVAIAVGVACLKAAFEPDRS